MISSDLLSLPVSSYAQHILVGYSDNLLFGLEMEHIIEIAAHDSLAANIPIHTTFLPTPYSISHPYQPTYLVYFDVKPGYCLGLEAIEDAFTHNSPIRLTHHQHTLPEAYVKHFVRYDKQLLPILDVENLFKTSTTIK